MDNNLKIVETFKPKTCIDTFVKCFNRFERMETKLLCCLASNSSGSTNYPCNNYDLVFEKRIL